jgi:hypothetical protein
MMGAESWDSTAQSYCIAERKQDETDIRPGTSRRKTLMQAVSVTVKTSDHYAAGRPVPVTVQITNESKRPVLLNKRLLVNHEISDGELFFVVESEQGNDYRHGFQALVTPRDLDDEDFVAVSPGDSISKTVDLADRYALKEKGFYTLTVTYRNEHEWSKDGLRAWKGSVRSNPARIRVN